MWPSLSHDSLSWKLKNYFLLEEPCRNYFKFANLCISPLLFRRSLEREAFVWADLWRASLLKVPLSSWQHLAIFPSIGHQPSLSTGLIKVNILFNGPSCYSTELLIQHPLQLQDLLDALYIRSTTVARVDQQFKEILNNGYLIEDFFVFLPFFFYIWISSFPIPFDY